MNRRSLVLGLLAALSAGCHDGTGPSATAAGYAFTFRYLDDAPPVLLQAMNSAAASWGRALQGGFPAIRVDTTLASCGLSSVGVHETVDGMLVMVNAQAIDGPGHTWGYAQICVLRDAPSTALVARIRIDTADIQTMVTLGTLFDLVRHELGHVVGFNPISFDAHACLMDPWFDPSAPTPPDTHFVCAHGAARFDLAGGVTYSATLKVPLENCLGLTGCGAAQANWHWRESVFGRELMTPYINTGGAPLSSVTLGALEDVGLHPNYGEAETWTLASPAPPPTALVGTDVFLADRPVPVLDRFGRLVAEIRPR